VGGGNDLERLKELAISKGLSGSHIDFTGPVPNNRIPDYYKVASFFVLNSNFETFNIATAEALLHGLPVVVTKCRGPEEYVDRNNGILVSTGSVRELTEGIMDMIRNLKNYIPESIAADANLKLVNIPLDIEFKKIFEGIESEL
jgi:glycosyltransferase involved in cell wall biosynthesis